MRYDSESLYALLPAIHRVRDAAQGEVLKELLTVVAEQLRAVEEDIDQLYDNLFIETCADWAVPYIGDLIGYRALHGAQGTLRSSRAEVANTIAYRRRKGTAAVLEQLARDVTGWDAGGGRVFLATRDHAALKPPPACTRLHSRPWPHGAARAARQRFRQAAAYRRCAAHRQRPRAAQHFQRRPFPVATRQPLMELGASGWRSWATRAAFCSIRWRSMCRSSRRRRRRPRSRISRSRRMSGCRSADASCAGAPRTITGRTRASSSSTE